MPDLDISKRSTNARGAVALISGGITAAFAVASCCAVPLLLTSAGLSAAWLGTISSMAVPYRGTLLLLGVLGLAGGAVSLWRIQRAVACEADGTCTPKWLRVTLLVGLLVGIVLLYGGYAYA